MVGTMQTTFVNAFSSKKKLQVLIQILLKFASKRPIENK